MKPLVVEGRIVNHDREFDGRIAIDAETGLIESVEKIAGSSDLDTKDCLIFPGFTDLHVHAREDMGHTQDYKEDFKTASLAALHGGVTQFVEMPNNPVPPIDDASYKAKEKLKNAHALVPAVLYAGIGPNTKPLKRTVPYKVFMGPSVGDLFFKSLADLEKVIAKYSGENISFHCEDPELLEAAKNKPTHELRRPPEAEVQAVEFALKLIKKYKLKAKFCHFSTLAALEKVRAARKQGIEVSIEISPVHLFFDQSKITDENHGWLQMNPPLRSKEDRLAMIKALKNGEIDFLATDHAPHTKEEKQRGTSGTPELDTYGGVAAWLMAEEGFRPTDIARVASFNPGQFISQFLDKKFGKIEPGYAASLTILDMKKPWTVRERDLKTKCAWSPFTGTTFPGSVKFTISLGKVYSF